MRLRQASGSRPDATVAARCSPLPVRRRRANLVSHLPWQTGASGARGRLLFKAAGNPPAARGLPNGDLAARMQPRAGAPVRSRERRPSFGRTTDGVSGPGRCNLRRGRSRRIPAATARSRSACALIRSRLRTRKSCALDITLSDRPGVQPGKQTAIRKRCALIAFRAANGAPEFARIPARMSGQPRDCDARALRSTALVAEAGRLEMTARSRSSCALPELAAPNPQELSAQRSAFRPARSSTWQAGRNPEEMRAHRFPSREWGAGIRQNSGQNERSRAVQPSPRPQ